MLCGGCRSSVVSQLTHPDGWCHPRNVGLGKKFWVFAHKRMKSGDTLEGAHLREASSGEWGWWSGFVQVLYGKGEVPSGRSEGRRWTAEENEGGSRKLRAPRPPYPRAPRLLDCSIFCFCKSDHPAVGWEAFVLPSHKKSRTAGFEPTRAEPNAFRVRLLNRLDTSAINRGRCRKARA